MRRLSLALLLALAGCTGAQLLNTTVPDTGITVQHEAYAPGPRGGVDVYRPTGTASALPMVIFLYGGSWRTGDKAIYPFVGTPLARRGVIVAIPDYRLYPEIAFPAFLQDNARAVAWAVAHAAELGADPARIFLMGHSAGAYDAAMLALDARWLHEAGTDRTRLAGVIALAGPYDFLPITDPDIIPVFAPVDDGPQSQPITFADGRNPPMLLMAGTADTTVDPRNTIRLAARIREKGGPVQTVLFPNVGHIGLITAFTPLFQRRAAVLDDVATFVRAGPVE